MSVMSPLIQSELPCNRQSNMKNIMTSLLNIYFIKYLLCLSFIDLETAGLFYEG